MDYPKVSIIIINSFNLDKISKNLISVLKTNYPAYEIIVVDYQTPHIFEFISRLNQGIKLVQVEGIDVGPSQMHNIGINHMDNDSKYVAFLDNDTIVDIDWLKELIVVIEKDESIGAVQSKLLLMNNKNILNSKGNKCNFLGVGWPNGYNQIDDGNELIKEISFPSGASVIFRKSYLKEVGMYDKHFFIYVDDMDVGLRLIINGKHIYYAPKSKVYHDYSFLKNKRNFYYLNRNRYFVLFSIYNKNTYVKILNSILLYEFFIFIYSFINKNMIELLKSYSDTIINFNYILIKRNMIKKIRKITDNQLIMSLESEINFEPILNTFVVKLLNPILKKQFYKVIK